jgi:hypothetical protein
MSELLDNGDDMWVAPDDQIAPHLEVTLVRDEFDRGSLENSISATIGGETIPIRSDPSGPLKLQIAYKLYLGAQKDVEDAVLLYTVRGHGQWRPSRSVSGETRRRGRVRTTRTRRRLDAVHDRMRVARRGEHPPGESVTSGSPEV